MAKWSEEKLTEALDPMKRQVSGDHYKTLGIQPLEVMQATLTPEEYVGFLKGNIIKYSIRQGRKDGSDDAGKARHYQELLIQYRKRLYESDPW